MKQILKFILYLSILVTTCYGFCGLFKLYDWLNTPVINFVWEDVFIDSTTLPFIGQRSDIRDGYGCIDSPLYSGCKNGFISKAIFYCSEGQKKAYQDIGYYVSENRAINAYSREKESWFQKYSNS